MHADLAKLIDAAQKKDKKVMRYFWITWTNESKKEDQVHKEAKKHLDELVDNIKEEAHHKEPHERKKLEVRF